MLRIKQRVAATMHRIPRPAIRAELKAQCQDIDAELQRRSLQSTADYVARHLGSVSSVTDKFELLDLALDAAAVPDDCLLEFGVFRGETIRHLAKRFAGEIVGFDSFEGLPEFWRTGFGAGAFKLDALPQVPAHVRLIKGWFSDTLPGFVATHRSPVRLLHVDCDLYSSTVTIFEALKDRLVSGTVIVFDEYFNYPGWEQGEYLAFQEFCSKWGRTYRYLTYNSAHEQVAVILGPPAVAGA